MVDYGPQTPMNTTTVATAVQRRWACHTRTVLPADAYGRQRCNVFTFPFTVSMDLSHTAAAETGIDGGLRTADSDEHNYCSHSSKA